MKSADVIPMHAHQTGGVCLSASVLLIKQGEANEPGLGEDLYYAMEKGGEMPDVYDDYPKNDSPELIKELIMKMTSYHTRDRPSAKDVVSVLQKLNTEVNLLPSDVERSPALRLLQALNDKSTTNFFTAVTKLKLRSWLKNKSTIRKCVSSSDVKDWINNHVDIKHLDNSHINLNSVEHVTCLTFASYVNDAGTVRQLVEAGSDVTVRDSRGRTPLHWACVSDVDANSKVLFLLQRDASLVNATDYKNFTALHHAVENGNSDVVTTLLGHGADVNARGWAGRTALHDASLRGHITCIHELMARGALIEARDSEHEATPLTLASDFSNPATVKTLVDVYKASINAADKDGNSALHWAALGGNVEVVKTLLSFDDCDVNAKGQLGRTALHNACQNGHDACIHGLIAGGAQIEARDSENEGTPLHLAAVFNHPDTVKTLVGVYKASINVTDKNGDSALQRAALEGYVEVVKSLLSFDHCDINAKGQLDRTALHGACIDGNVACIHELMAGGAEIEARDSEREATPLHMAADFNHPDSVKTLVEVYKASINAADSHGNHILHKYFNTALHFAAFRGHTEIARVLTSYPQCDITIRDSDGNTAAEDARGRGHKDIVALIEAKIKGKIVQFIAFIT